MAWEPPWRLRRGPSTGETPPPRAEARAGATGLPSDSSADHPALQERPEPEGFTRRGGWILVLIGAVLVLLAILILVFL